MPRPTRSARRATRVISESRLLKPSRESGKFVCVSLKRLVRRVNGLSPRATPRPTRSARLAAKVSFGSPLLRESLRRENWTCVSLTRNAMRGSGPALWAQRRQIPLALSVLPAPRGQTPLRTAALPKPHHPAALAWTSRGTRMKRVSRNAKSARAVTLAWLQPVRKLRAGTRPVTPIHATDPQVCLQTLWWWGQNARIMVSTNRPARCRAKLVSTPAPAPLSHALRMASQPRRRTRAKSHAQVRVCVCVCVRVCASLSLSLSLSVCVCVCVCVSC